MRRCRSSKRRATSKPSSTPTATLSRTPAATSQGDGAGDTADVADGTGGLADRDQATRHQRRRLLQRQLGPSIREPHAAVELLRDAVHPADLGGAVLHL